MLHELLNQGEERGSAGREESTSTQRRKGKDEGASERDGKVFLMLFSSFFLGGGSLDVLLDPRFYETDLYP